MTLLNFTWTTARTYAYVTLNVELEDYSRRAAAIARLKIKQRQIAAWRLSNEGHFSLIILKLQCARARLDNRASYPRDLSQSPVSVASARLELSCAFHERARINAGT